MDCQATLQREFDYIFGFSETIDSLDKNEDVWTKNAKKSIENRVIGNVHDLCRVKQDTEFYHKTLLFYTRSIAFAPADSEELAKGYSDRSDLLLYLSHFEKSLVDIDRALKISKDEELKEKLIARRRTCLTLLNDHPEIQERRIKRPVIHEYSKEIPSASESVTLEYDETIGSHLVATRDIEVGEIVIIEKENAAFLQPSEMYINCAHCLNFTLNALPCESCPFAVYCNKECKEAAWKKYHDMECPMLRYFYYYLIAEEKQIINFVLASKIIITALKREGLQSLVEEMNNINEKSGE